MKKIRITSETRKQYTLLFSYSGSACHEALPLIRNDPQVLDDDTIDGFFHTLVWRREYKKR